LTTAQQAQLGQLLSQQDFWSLSQISQLVQQHFICSYSPSGLRRLLKRMNLYHYKPQPRDYRQSPTAQQQLQTRLQATLDAMSLRQESLTDFAIGFADEFAPQLHHNRARFWSVFKDRLRPLNTTRFSQSTFGFYAIQGQSVLEFMVNGKAASMQLMLQAVRRANPDARRILLFWDNARAHLDRGVQALAWSLGIYLVALPSYSPNLNPIERVWKSIRRGLSEVGLIDSVSSLQHHIKRLFDSLIPSCSFAKSWIEQLLSPVYKLSPISK
jgi:putative transposase